MTKLLPVDPHNHTDADLAWCIGAAKHQDYWQLILGRFSGHKGEAFPAALCKQTVAAANWELGPPVPLTQGAGLKWIKCAL